MRLVRMSSRTLIAAEKAVERNGNTIKHVYIII